MASKPWYQQVLEDIGDSDASDGESPLNESHIPPTRVLTRPSPGRPSFSLSPLQPPVPAASGRWQPSSEGLRWVEEVTMGGTALERRRVQDVERGRYSIGSRCGFSLEIGGSLYSLVK